MSREIKNAVIDGISLSTEDHGCLTMWVHLDYGGSSQGFGGHALYLPDSFTHHDIQSPCGHFIYNVMQMAGVEKFEQLKGKTVRVDCDWGKVYGIGHIVKNEWFYPEKDFGKEADNA